jgi:hypothetical protein
MKTVFYTAILFCVILTSCNSKPTLENYFVDNTENKNFVQVDVSPSMLNMDKTKLSSEQTLALKSFDKMNVLFFKINEKNKSQFETERVKVNEILKDTATYQQLMKFGSGKEGASVNFVGTDEHISEFVFYGNKSDTGFGIIRVLGKDMNPTSVLSILSALKNSNLNIKELKSITDMLN